MSEIYLTCPVCWNNGQPWYHGEIMTPDRQLKQAIICPHCETPLYYDAEMRKIIEQQA